jgi:hypothetical protein
MSKKITTEEFIKKSRNMRGDKYDYSESVYINAKTKIKIKCKKYKRAFVQTPNNHLFGKNGYQYALAQIFQKLKQSG